MGKREAIAAAVRAVRKPSEPEPTLEQRIAAEVARHPLIVALNERAAAWADPTASPAKPEPPPPPDPAAELQRAKAREQLREAAIAAGVRAEALRDFEARAEHDLPRLASKVDPTSDRMSQAEFVEHLRVAAPHLFVPRGNGRAAQW